MKLRTIALVCPTLLVLQTFPLFAQRSTTGGTFGGTSRSSVGSPSIPDVGRTNKNSQVTIEVRVDDREPITDAPVLVELNAFGAPVARSYTDSSGRATFRNLAQGSYVANVSGPNIQPASVSFTIDFNNLQFVTASVHRSEQAEERAPAGLIDASELNAPKNAHKEYDKGVHEYAANHLDKAEEHFRKAVNEYPKYSSAWNNLGNLSIRSKDLVGAEQCFRKALDANPNNNYAARNLARLLIDKKNTKEAEQLMKRAVVTEPNHPESLVILAFAELQNGEFDDAIATAKRVHTGTTHGGALSHLIAARALELKQQNVAAISEYQLFLKEAPKSPQAKVAQDALARLGANQEASK